MAVGAQSQPVGVFTGGVGGVCPAPSVTEFPSLCKPQRSVACSGANQRVRDFVQEHLLDVIMRALVTEIARESDPQPPVITLAEAGFGVIETERPAGIQAVQSEELVCSLFNPSAGGHC